MVLWRALFSNVSALVAQTGQSGIPNGVPLGEDGDAQNRKKNNPQPSINVNGMADAKSTDNEDDTHTAVEELNAVRSREIVSKAVSGILLILLKWFRLSRKRCSTLPALCAISLTLAKTFSNSSILTNCYSTLITYL